jgi:hypothetical protein
VGLLQVDAQQLLAAGDEARLQGGRARGVGDQEALDAPLLADQAQRLVPLGVAADDPDQGHLAPQGRHVAGDVAGRAQHDQLAGAGQHRDRRLGRDAADVAVDEAVDHQVADAGHARPGQGGEQRLESRKVHG